MKSNFKCPDCGPLDPLEINFHESYNHAFDIHNFEKFMVCAKCGLFVEKIPQGREPFLNEKGRAFVWAACVAMGALFVAYLLGLV